MVYLGLFLMFQVLRTGSVWMRNMYLTRRLGVIEILQVFLANLVDNEQLPDCFIGAI